MGFDRNPTVLFQVIKELCQEVEDFETDFELLLVGQVDYTVKESYEKSGITKNVSFKGSVQRTEALKYIAQSPILLLLLNQQENAKGRIPGKLFEYLAVRRTILCLGPTDSDVADILDKSQGGTTLEYDDSKGIKDLILNKYRDWKDGKMNQPIDSNIAAYSHVQMAKNIAGYLNTISQ